MVNEGSRAECEQCGAELSPLRFNRPHLRHGMRLPIGKVSASLRYMRLPGGDAIETPDGEVLFIRRCWTAKECEPQTLDIEETAPPSHASDLDMWDFGAVGMLLAGFVEVLKGAVDLFKIAVVSFDRIGSWTFGAIGHFVLRRPWLIQVYRGNPPTVYRTFRVGGYRRTAEAIGELKLAYQTGDVGFVPSAAQLP